MPPSDSRPSQQPTRNPGLAAGSVRVVRLVLRGIAAVLSLPVAIILLAGNSSASQEKLVAELWHKQLSALPEVKEFSARYTVVTGMSRSAQIRIVPLEGSDPLALLVQVMKVAATARHIVAPSAGVSITILISDDGPVLDPRDVGLSQKPPMSDLAAYVDTLR